MPKMADTVKPGSQATVMVVNPDPVRRAYLTQRLTASGHEVESFDSARAAIERLAPPRYTVVLVVHHELDNMTALEFIDEIRARGVFLPTIVTVPPHAVDAAVEAIRRGATDVLEEPLDDRDLEESIAVALAQAGKPVIAAG
jgi:DNA-binding NtrC family response regulator